MSAHCLKPGFTKGPWNNRSERGQRFGCAACVNTGDNTSTIAIVYGDSEAEQMANSRLIGHAPEMFEILRAGLEDGDPMNWNRVSDLLYKITGQE